MKIIKKKGLALLAGVAMFAGLTTIPGVSGAEKLEGLVYSNEFSDVTQDNRFYDDILYLSERNSFGNAFSIINGYDDGTFRPGKTITRGEAAALIVRASGVGYVYRAPHAKDVAKSSMLSQMIATAEEHNLVTGYPDGTFRPEKSITRGEMAILVNRILKLEAPSGKNEWASRFAAFHKKDAAKLAEPFGDVGSQSKAYAAIHNLKAFDISGGFPGNKYKPEQLVTRGETAALLRRGLTNAQTITGSNYLKATVGPHGQLLTSRLRNVQVCNLNIPSTPVLDTTESGAETKHRYYSDGYLDEDWHDAEVCDRIYGFNTTKSVDASAEEKGIIRLFKDGNGTMKSEVLANGAELSDDALFIFHERKENLYQNNAFYYIYDMKHEMRVKVHFNDGIIYVNQKANIVVDTTKGQGEDSKVAYPTLFDNKDGFKDFGDVISAKYNEADNTIIVTKKEQTTRTPHTVIPEEITEIPVSEKTILVPYWNKTIGKTVRVELHLQTISH